mgnify:CR=1 FL=1
MDFNKIVKGLSSSGAVSGFAQEEDASVFRVALTGKYPPFSMYDSENAYLVGLNPEQIRSSR